MNNLNVAKIQLNGDTYEINNGKNLNEIKIFNQIFHVIKLV